MHRYCVRDFFRKIRSILGLYTFVSHKTEFYSGLFYKGAFAHSGTLGDIIYSLLFIKTYSNGSAKLHILSDQIQRSVPYQKTHIGGNKMITDKMFDFIKPLILIQPYIKDVLFTCENEIDYNSTTNLDYFRHFKINANYNHIRLSSGDLRNWYSKAFGMSVNLAEKFLFLEQSSKYDFLKDAVLVCRTLRHNNSAIDYSILNEFENVYFMGLQNEFDTFKSEFKLDKIKQVQINDALDAAYAIDACRVFISNQTCFMAIAEGLKKPNRCLEVYERSPNVILIGEKILEFLSTKHLYNYLKNIFTNN